MRKVDIDLAAVSLMGMILVFQFMRPFISFGLGNIQYDERFIKRISNHTIDLFLNGASAAASSKKKPIADKRK